MEANMVVREVMSLTPVAVEVTESIASARAKLRDADVRHLPVVDRGTLVGIVSDRDIPPVYLDPGSLTPLGSTLEAAISSVMSSDVLSTHPEAELSEVIDLMIEYKIGAVPVVETDSLKLIGIVSYVDVLRAARNSL
jgi:acetoin utilization protein AcuB